MLKIYNTLTRDKQDFVSIEPGKVRMYVCGMTVYDYCHLGHARVMVVFDMVYRWLKATGLDVTYVRNITDIDDKIIKRAAENGESVYSLTQRFIDACMKMTCALVLARIGSLGLQYISQLLIDHQGRRMDDYQAADENMNCAVDSAVTEMGSRWRICAQAARGSIGGRGPSGSYSETCQEEEPEEVKWVRHGEDGGILNV